MLIPLDFQSGIVSCFHLASVEKAHTDTQKGVTVKTRPVFNTNIPPPFKFLIQEAQILFFLTQFSQITEAVEYFSFPGSFDAASAAAQAGSKTQGKWRGKCNQVDSFPGFQLKGILCVRKTHIGARQEGSGGDLPRTLKQKGVLNK